MGSHGRNVDYMQDCQGLAASPISTGRMNPE